jgi:hypothetical protein
MELLGHMVTLHVIEVLLASLSSKAAAEFIHYFVKSKDTLPTTFEIFAL